MTEEKVTIGVDTHKYFHVAVALSEQGARLGELTVAADPGGYQQLLRERRPRSAGRDRDRNPKSGDGTSEMIREIKIARDTAVKARSQAIITLKALIVTAPDELCGELQPLSKAKLRERCAGLCQGRSKTGPLLPVEKWATLLRLSIPLQMA